MTNPIHPITQAALFAAFTALIQGGVASLITLAENCNDAQDFITGGCADFTTEILQIVGLGIIPGAPLVVNLLFGAFGIAQRLTIIVWIIEQGPWAMLTAGIIAALTAVVAWLA